MRGHPEIQEIYDYTKDDLSDWFPRLPAYTTYIQRLNRLSEVFVPLLGQFHQDFPQINDLEMIRLIGSMPIIMAKAQRSGKATVAPDLANKGYNATKKTYGSLGFSVVAEFNKINRLMEIPLLERCQKQTKNMKLWINFYEVTRFARYFAVKSGSKPYFKLHKKDNLLLLKDSLTTEKPKEP